MTHPHPKVTAYVEKFGKEPDFDSPEWHVWFHGWDAAVRWCTEEMHRSVERAKEKS